MYFVLKIQVLQAFQISDIDSGSKLNQDNGLR